MNDLKSKLLSVIRCNLLTGEDLEELLKEAWNRIDDLEDANAYLQDEVSSYQMRSDPYAEGGYL